MTKPIEIVDSFEIPKNSVSWSVNENKEDKVVDGVHILGRAVGPFFVTEKSSRNNRYYTKKLWERALNENTERLSNGEMLGTIGHDQALDDQALLDGKVSHKVTKLWIDESTGTGMGEIVILSTPAGKVLNSLMRGGVRLKVSSRAMGEFNGKTKDGAQVVDETTFDLKGFDFVQNPGVVTAIPILVESQQSKTNADKVAELPTGNTNVENQQLLESLSRDKMKMEERLNEALAKNVTATNEADALRRDLEARNKEVERLAESLSQSKITITDLEGKVTLSGEQAKEYAAFGTPDEVTEKLLSNENLLNAYRKFDTPEKLTEAFERAHDLVEEFEELGSPEEIEYLQNVLESYVELGSYDELSAKLDTLKKFEEFGSIEELSKVFSTAEAYAPYGSPEELEEAFAMTASIVQKYKDEALQKEIDDLATQFGVKSEDVAPMLSKMGKEETTKILESMIQNNVSNRYRRSSRQDERFDESVTRDNKLDKLSEEVKGDGSRAGRLMEQFSFGKKNQE